MQNGNGKRFHNQSVLKYNPQYVYCPLLKAAKAQMAKLKTSMIST